jgi:hypothetical protein
VAGFSTSRALVQEFVQRGVECAHLFSRPDFGEYHIRSFDPANYAVDLGYAGDAPAAIEALRAIGIDRVIPGAESCVILTDQIRSRSRRAGPAAPATDLGTSSDRKMSQR